MVGSLSLPPALVVGLEENGLGVTRSLRRHNIPCIALATPWWNACCRTNSCKVVHAREWNKEAFFTDLTRIGMTLGAKAPLLITKDEPVLWTSEIREQLSRYYVINLPESDTVNLLMNKQRFTKLALEHGWPVPKTWHITGPDSLASQISQITFPCILKPAVKTSAFRKRAAAKAWFITDREELTRIYGVFAKWEEGAVAQEWIEGGDERVVYCLAYYTSQSEPLALFAGRKVRQCPLGCGNTAFAEPAPKNWAAKIIDLSDEIFRQVGYRGLGSIEYKMRVHSDEPVLMEPTVGRTDYQSEVAVINGQDIPTIAYYDMAGLGQFPAYCRRRPVKLIDGGAERKAAWQLHRQGKLTIKQWLADWRGKKRFMRLRLSDPGPFLTLSYAELQALTRRMLRIVTDRK